MKFASRLQLNKRWDEAPEELREAIFSDDLGDILEAIIADNGISEDMQKELMKVCIHVFLGFISQKDSYLALVDLFQDKKKALDIYQGIQTKIFSPYDVQINSFYFEMQRKEVDEQHLVQEPITQEKIDLKFKTQPEALNLKEVTASVKSDGPAVIFDPTPKINPARPVPQQPVAAPQPIQPPGIRATVQNTQQFPPTPLDVSSATRPVPTNSFPFQSASGQVPPQPQKATTQPLIQNSVTNQGMMYQQPQNFQPRQSPVIPPQPMQKNPFSSGTTWPIQQPMNTPRPVVQNAPGVIHQSFNNSFSGFHPQPNVSQQFPAMQRPAQPIQSTSTPAPSAQQQAFSDAPFIIHQKEAINPVAQASREYKQMSYGNFMGSLRTPMGQANPQQERKNTARAQVEIPVFMDPNAAAQPEKTVPLNVKKYDTSPPQSVNYGESPQ